MITKFWLYATIALLAIAAGLTSLTSELIYADERAARELHAVAGFTDVRNLASQTAPLRQFTLLADTAIWQKDNLGYHAANLAYHALASIMLFALLRRLLDRQPAALWAAGLFALMPIGAAAFSVVAHRGEILGALMIFSAGLAWLRPQRDWTAWTVGGVCAALAAIETSLSLLLPLLLFAYDQLLLPPSQRRERARWVDAVAVAIAVCAIHLVHRSWVSTYGSWMPESWETSPTWSEAPLCLLRDWPAGIFTALRWLAVPLPFMHDHGLTPSSWLLTLVGLVTLAAFIALIRRQARPQPRIAFAITWLLAGCAIAALNVFRSRYGAIFEHELYAVAPGFCLLGGIAIEQLCKLERNSRRFWVEIGALAVVALALCGWSNWRAYQFRSEARMLSTTLSNHPGSGLCHLAMGRLCLDASRRATEKGVMRVTAEREFEKARDAGWNYYETYGNLGEVAMLKRDYTRAEACYRQALTLHPTGTGGRLRLGNALHAQQRYAAAREIYQQLLVEKPRAIDLYRLIADTYESENRPAEAKPFIQQAARLAEELRQKEMEFQGKPAALVPDIPPVLAPPATPAPQTNAVRRTMP